MSKRLVRIVCAALAVLMVLSIVVPLMYTSYATEAGTSTADDTAAPAADPPASSSMTAAEKAASDSLSRAAAASSKKAEADAKRQEYQDQMKALQDEAKKIANDLKASETNLAQQKKTKQYYEQQANNLAAQIELLKTDIANKETELAQKQAELEAKALEVKDTTTLFENRLKAMYIMKNDSDLSTVLGVTSFSDAMRYAENLQQISLNDTELIALLRTQQEELDQQAKDVQAALDELSATRTELEQKSTEYAAAIVKVKGDIDNTEATIEANEAAYAENALKQKEAQAAWQEFAKANGSLGFTWDGGTLSWPLPGYYRLSSDYNHVRVIYGVRDVHRGMDLPAPAGTPIYAAARGQVSTIAHWSYGTCVKIDHGSGLVSIYGHMIARYVENGQMVEKGTQIGGVGSTGNSTGNHLHFEVDLNGSPVSPRNYLDPAVVGQLYW